MAPIKALLTRYDEVNAKLGEDLSPDEMEKVLDEQSRIQDKIDASNAWDLDSRLELAMDALRLPPPDADVHDAVRRRAPARGALPAAAAVARPAAARRADEPSRRRVGGLARAVPQGLSRHGRRGDARSLLPRQRRRLDSRARSRPRAFPGKATTRRGSSRSRTGSQQEEKAETRRQRTLERELEWIRMSPRARQAKGKARLNAYEELLREETAQKIETAEIYIAPGPRLGDVVVEARHLQQGLRRQPADRGPELHAAARRHRRRDRPERRRQDDAVPDDHGAGEARRRHAEDRRDRADRLRRSEPRGARREQDGLGGDLRRPRRDRARQAQGRLARLRVVVQLQGRRRSSGRSARCRAASATASTWRSC